jgi:hypothetical protein
MKIAFAMVAGLLLAGCAQDQSALQQDGLEAPARGVALHGIIPGQHPADVLPDVSDPI